MEKKRGKGVKRYGEERGRNRMRQLRVKAEDKEKMKSKRRVNRGRK